MIDIQTETQLSPSEVLDASADLEEGLSEKDAVARNADAVKRLIAAAVNAGEAAWEPEERRKLRRVVSRWTAALRQVGEPVELPDLPPFAGHLPSLSPIDAQTLVDLARRDKPIVAHRLERGDLRALSGIARVRIVDCVLVECDLSEIELPRARLLHTTFERCDFTSTTLSEVVATSSVFSGGSLRGVDAPRGTFCGSRFDGVSMEMDANSNAANFTEASFAASTIRELSASDAKFVDALFDLATIDSVQFDRSSLRDAVFTGATVRSSTFHDADLTLALFSSADVRASSFLDAQLAQATFLTAVDVARAEFGPSAVEQAAFSSADVEWLRALRSG